MISGVLVEEAPGGMQAWQSGWREGRLGAGGPGGVAIGLSPANILRATQRS